MNHLRHLRSYKFCFKAVKFNRKERKVLRKVLKAAKNISHWSFFEAVKFNCKRHKDVSQVRKEKLKCPFMPYMVLKKIEGLWI